MSREQIHLPFLEESKKEEYNFYDFHDCVKKSLHNKPSKKKQILNKIKDARYDEARQQANLYAMSMGKEPPNKLSYEKEIK